MDLDFVNTITINNKNILYKELKVKHLKIIYKTLLGDTPDPKTVFINFNSILKNITNISEEDLLKLNFVNYFLLLIELRITSIGDTIFAQSQEDSNTKIEFNLFKIKEQLLHILDLYQNKNYFYENINVTLDLPTIDEVLFINKLKETDSLYSCFIKEIKINNTVIDFKTLMIEDKNNLFEQLPAKLTSILIKDILKEINELTTLNLVSYFTSIKNVSLPFNLNITNLVLLLKFFFGDSLMLLYENILGLCKAGKLTPEYIENCTPGEYILFVKKLEQINNQQTQSNNITEENNLNDGLNPYDSPDLPPITSQANLASLRP